MLIQDAVAVASVVALVVAVAATQSPATAGPKAIAGGPTSDAAPEVTAQRGESPFTEGDIFPDLAFPSLEPGAPTRLSQFRGKKVMLHVFASW